MPAPRTAPMISPAAIHNSLTDNLAATFEISCHISKKRLSSHVSVETYPQCTAIIGIGDSRWWVNSGPSQQELFVVRSNIKEYKRYGNRHR